MHAQSFKPIETAASRLLILGSMPGKVSLNAQQYYAHPRNLFWDFMEDYFAIPRESTYLQRIALLKKNKIALWDVLKICERSSSLDADIVNSTLVANSFVEFFNAHPNITSVFFNGAKAESIYQKHVLPSLDPTRMLQYHRLPSTSPANASISCDIKHKRWRIIRDAMT